MPPSSLGLADDDVCVHWHEAPPNDETAGFQVDILPEKTECFSSPKTGERQSEPQGVEPILFHASKEGLKLLDLPGLDGLGLGVNLSWRVCAHSWVAREIPPADGITERPVKRGVDPAHRVRGELP
jgi:hypothetical protein